VIVDYINEFKGQFGVEPICRALTEHGCPIAPSTYYDNVNRPPSKRALRDLEIVEFIIKAREHKHRRKFGARKMWLHLRANGHDVARCTVERLFNDQGWAGVLRGKKIRTTIADAEHRRPTDLVDRHFFASRPNQLWVADFTSRPGA
jgi:putative transposase